MGNLNEKYWLFVVEIPTNYNIMLTAPAKTVSSIPHKTRAAILVAATKIWNKLPLPIRIPMSPASSFRTRGNGTAKVVNTLTNCWRQPNFFINSMQHICTNPCNFEVSPSASRPSHKWAKAVMVQLVLFISGSEFPGTVLVMDVTIALHLKTFHRPLRR